ncbi:MAG: PTS sugar transporter subunit IIB [bacterium]
MLVLTRVDDRLIHGMIIIGWAHYTNADIIIVANDEIANDEMRKTLMEMIVPPNIKAYILGIKESVEKLAHKELEKKRIILLFNNPKDVLTFLDYSNIYFDKLNIGPMSYEENKIEIFSGIAISEQDKESFINIHKKGIKLEIRVTPSDQKTDLIKLLDNTKFKT